MHIECTTCGHREEVNKHLVLKIIGATFAGGGFWAWVTFFFAGNRPCAAHLYRPCDWRRGTGSLCQ